MSGVKAYFQSRVGRKMSWSADAVRAGFAARRDYEIVPRGIDGDSLLATVGWTDVDRDGRRIQGSKVEPVVVKVRLRGLDGAAEALEDAAREADPAFFAGRPAPQRGTGAADLQAVEARLAELATPEGRADGEAAPLAASVARFRAFWTLVPNLVAPTLFSSKDGTLRGRWNHGHDRMLWVNFPAQGPLGWSLSIPRQGGYGLRKLSARCIDDQDVVPFAEALGVRCTK